MIDYSIADYQKQLESALRPLLSARFDGKAVPFVQIGPDPEFPAFTRIRVGANVTRTLAVEELVDPEEELHQRVNQVIHDFVWAVRKGALEFVKVEVGDDE